MDAYRKVRVFLASPGEVAQERAIAREVLDEINRTVADERGVVFQVYGWDSDAYPGYGGDGQSIINREIGDMGRYDLFIGIMWNRFGTETPRAGSGTEEEFDRAVKSFEQNARPDIWLYFRQGAADLNTQAQLTQKMKVLAFRERGQKKGLTWDYSSPEEFRRVFHGHVVRWLTDTTRRVPEPPQASSGVAEPSSPARTISEEPKTVQDSGAWVLLGASFYSAESVAERADGTIQATIEPASTDEDAALRSLRPGEYGRGEPVPYAYQNDAFLAKVVTAERNSTAGRSFWTVTLKPEPDQSSGFGVEMAFNGISADEIAAMRARLLLLNETPARSGRDMNDQMLLSMVQGHGPVVRVERSPFPELWEQFRSQPEMFLPMARLYAVFLLKATGTCEHVLDLTLGPISDERLAVKFRGRRRKEYSNRPASEIQVAGECRLV
jgi:hypothetical protein